MPTQKVYFRFISTFFKYEADRIKGGTEKTALFTGSGNRQKFGN